MNNSVTASSEAATSRQAVWGFVFGFLGFISCGLGGLIGLIISIKALGQVGRSQGRLKGHGLAVAGITISGISLVSGCTSCLLIGILLPSLAKARSMAKASLEETSVSNLSAAIAMYAAEHDDGFPPPDSWDDALWEYVQSERTFLSPADPTAGRAFAMNAALADLKYDAIAEPERTVMLFECAFGSPPAGGPELLPAQPRYVDGHLILFVDGTAERVAPSVVKALIWEPQAPE